MVINLKKSLYFIEIYNLFDTLSSFFCNFAPGKNPKQTDTSTLMANNNEIGSVLKDLRNRMGYSQEQISSYLGISQPAYNHYESGDTVVSQDSLEKLADIYGVEEYDILTCNKPQLQADMAFAFRKNGEVKNLAQIASFQRLVKNYLDMCEIERRHE